VATPVLEVNKLTKIYGSYRAVDGVSFTIRKGEVLGLLGPNGAGKSTTIQMLVGITLPTSGTVKYFGQDFKSAPKDALRRINFASAYNTLQGRMSVRENLLVFAGLYGVADPKQKIEQLLDYFEIQDLAAHRYWDLSAGERTRVNLAKSLLNDPELILMDEPTASLDPDIADKTLSLIEELRRTRDLSILFTSHNMAEVERVCDYVIFLDHGKIVSQDTPTGHIKQFGNEEVILTFTGAKDAVSDILNSRHITHSFTGKSVHFKVESAAVAKLVGALDRAGIVITEVSVEKPDLEDVFLNVARGERDEA
jgi:ABC-2 type transport system ATP-binding protein